MENYTIILVILGIIILLTALAEQLNWSSPIFLIIAGIGLSFIPGFKPISISSEIIFLLFLPPLLYDAAVNISQEDFKEHWPTISSLAFGLVFITTLGIAVTAKFLIPGMTWPLSLLLGGILSATDAVAAIGVTKNLGLSHKTSVILEGESLLNDASALVVYRFALAAVMGSAFVWWKAGLSFFVLIIGGAMVGFVMRYALSILLRLVRNNATAVNCFLLLAPFVTYLIAEEMHVSGVIAVVVLGFYVSRLSKKLFSEKIKSQSKSIWEMVIFLLNGLVFILIGLELKDVIENLNTHTIINYSIYALAITLAAIALRMLRVFAKKNGLQMAFLNPKFQKSKRKISENALINFQESLIISLSGMRGIVSLAIALALPMQLDNGALFPMRNAILFITFMVILYTVIGQGLLLPYVIKRMQKTQV